MVSIFDQVSARRPLGRRDFLRLGSLTLGGATLSWGPELAAAEGGRGPTTGKSVIFLFMQGGPPQHETFDPKTSAPSEIASVGGDVATSVPGVRFGASLQKLAPWAHRLAIIRNYQTGTDHGGMLPLVGPSTQGASLGSVYSRVAGTNHRSTGLPNALFLVPKSVDGELDHLGERFGKFDATGPLGPAYAPFMPGGGGPLQAAMNLNLPRERFEDRLALLKQVEGARRRLDAVAETQGLDGLRLQAVDLVLKGVAEAFDLSREDPQTIEKYDTSAYCQSTHWTEPGGKEKNNKKWYTAHTQSLGKLLLLARRLAEAGCGMITIHSEFVWDFHADGNNVAVAQGRPLVIEPFDHAVAAFIEDCEARGLSERILLVCGGEMGRTPKLNNRGGRDHWPRLAPLMLYGGGMTDGQVMGQSTRDGGESRGTPQTPDDLLATICHTLFDFGEARLIPGLPFELRELLERMERRRGVLG